MRIPLLLIAMKLVDDKIGKQRWGECGFWTQRERETLDDSQWLVHKYFLIGDRWSLTQIHCERLFCGSRERPLERWLTTDQSDFLLENFLPIAVNDWQTTPGRETVRASLGAGDERRLVCREQAGMTVSLSRTGLDR